jgi:outer membrane lipoprotein-sorting protein
MSRRFAAGTAVGATLVLSLTGCLGDSGGGSAGGGGAVQLTAAQVLEKASQKTDQVDTYKADFTMNVGTQQGALNMHALGQFRLKPSLAFRMNVDKMGMGGQSMPIGAIQVVYLDKVIYMKSAQLSQATGGKPWLKMDLGRQAQQSGFNLDALMNQSQQVNPAEQTKMLTASKDVKKVGEETINGVKTTHYTGSITVAEAMNKLDAKTRQQLQKVYQQVGAKKIFFDLWADGQQLPRKLTTKIAIPQGNTSNTIIYEDYGSPVNVSAPPADQVGDFRGLSGGRGPGN